MKKYRIQYLRKDEINFIFSLQYGFIIFILITLILQYKGIFYDYFKYRSKMKNIITLVFVCVSIFILYSSNRSYYLMSIIIPLYVFILNFLWYKGL